MRALALMLLLLPALLAGCRDQPPAPPCRAEPREEPPLHANAGCLVVEDGALLVLKHRFGGKLGIPGGAANEGETAQCTAHRETWEETGLDVRVGERVGRLRYGFTLYHCYPREPMDTARDLDIPWHSWLEITNAVWLPPEDIPADQWRYVDQVDAFMDLVRRLQPKPAQPPPATSRDSEQTDSADGS
jgi:8-oxo-dGTP diphosphatase